MTVGKLLSNMLMKKKPNMASQTFRNPANAVQRSNNWPGDYFRGIKAKGGNNYTMVATPSKKATIYYKMVSNRLEFNSVDLHEYQKKYRLPKLHIWNGNLMK